jgi:outer membrane protein
MHRPSHKAWRATGLGLVSAWALLAGTGARAQSLQETLVQAYQNNPQLLSERATARATDEAVPQALSGWRPTISVNASAGFTQSNERGAGVTPPNVPQAFSAELPRSTPDQPTDYGVTLTQPLFTGGHTTAATAEALSQVRAERANLVAVEESVLLTAATDYVNVVEDQATLDLNINNEQVLRRQLDYTQDRFNVGEVTRTDVAQAESSLAQAIAERQQAEAGLQIARATYQQDIGVAPGKLKAPDLSPELPTSRDEAVSVAMSADPQVVTAQFTLQAAQDDIRVVRSQLLPTVSLTASAGRSNNVDIMGREADSESITADMSVPLYEAGKVYSESRQAQQTVTADRSKLDQARQAAMQASASAWEQLREARANIVSFKAQIDANSIALEGVQQEAAVGERTVLDILNAEQTLFQSRVSLVQSEHDELVSEFTLAVALGRLTAKNLALPVQLYDPDQNFNAVRNKWIGFGTGQ